MLLEEKMKQTNFSESEQMVVNFILEKQLAIQDYSTVMIANETFTSPSVLIRIAKKLGFNGWLDLKRDYLAEVKYLQTHFQTIDANKPFTATDSLMTIAGKVTQAETESLQDTLDLLRHDDLAKALQIIQTHQKIKLFSLSNLIFLSEEFAFKMRHINKATETFPIQNTMLQEAVMTTAADCAIILSYSGVSDPLFDTIAQLKKNQVPIIAITSIGENKLSQVADVTLNVTTREHAYSKIAGFTSLTSMSQLLDIIYATYFALDYHKNYDYKTKVSEATEFRKVNNKIIQED